MRLNPRLIACTASIRSNRRREIHVPEIRTSWLTHRLVELNKGREFSGWFCNSTRDLNILSKGK